MKSNNIKQEVTKKSRKKVFFKFLALGISLILVSILSLAALFFCVTINTHINTSALSSGDSTKITIVSSSLNPIPAKFSSESSKVNLSNLNKFTPQAFVSIEDKRFYKHNGIDVIRMAGAIVSNIKAGKTVQGASTISQQLAKNAFLSGEKTLERKLKEIKLAFELEKTYSKNEILEFYLNSIYFGNGCYGIEDASRFYFNKGAASLTLNESAMLAAIINAPSLYNPLTNLNKVTERKNLVLKNMLNDGAISESEYSIAANEPINISAKNNSNAYATSVISEACEILGENENTLANKNYTIVTFLDEQVQQNLLSNINSNAYTPLDGESRPNLISIVLDNETNAVIALGTNMRQIPANFRREPGSVLKPLAVYAPALEYNIITPATQILDAPINIDGYTPNNSNDQFSGYVSVRESLAKSLNIPAVKIMQSTGVNKSKKVAEKFGIPFDAKDNNLALALGGMTTGVTIKEIADAYACIARGGEFSQSAFIKEIKNANGDIVYSYSPKARRAISAETAYILTDMLTSVSTSGTASRLSDLGFEVASKTGTAGISRSKNNSDAWSVSFTPSNTVVTWIGSPSSSGMSPKINGSTYPTLLNKSTLTSLNSYRLTKGFSVPDGVSWLDIDERVKENQHVIKLANKNLPERYKSRELFNLKNLPEQSDLLLLDAPKISIKVNNKLPEISFDSTKGVTYAIIREFGEKSEIIANLSGTNEKLSFIDNTAEKNRLICYYVIASADNLSATSNTVKVYVT